MIEPRSELENALDVILLSISSRVEGISDEMLCVVACCRRQGAEYNILCWSKGVHYGVDYWSVASLDSVSTKAKVAWQNSLSSSIRSPLLIALVAK